MPNNNLEGWEKEFDLLLLDFAKKVVDDRGGLNDSAEDVKSFIRSLFSYLQQKVDVMRKDYKIAAQEAEKANSAEARLIYLSKSQVLFDVLALFPKDK